MTLPMLGWLTRVLAADRGMFARTVGAAAATTVAAAATAGMSATLVSRIVSGAPGSVAALLALMVAGVLGQATAAWAEMMWAHDLAFRVLARLRLQVFDGLERTAPGGLAHRRTGAVAGAAMADVEALEWFYAHTAPTAVAAVLSPAVILGAVGALAGPLWLITAGGLVLAAAVPWILRRAADRQGERVRAGLGELRALTLEGVQGLRELLTFGRVADHIRAVSARAAGVHLAQRRYALRAGGEAALGELVVAATAVTFLAVGTTQVRAGRLGPTELVVASVVGLVAFGPVLEIAGMVGKLGEITAATRRVMDLALAPPNVPDTVPSVTAPIGDAARTATAAADGSEPTGPAGVNLAGVGFGYDPDRPPVLGDVTVEIAPGSSVALAGRSGSGKTTLAHLLMRFWDPDHGRIRLGDQILDRTPQDAVRRRVGLVPQDVHLFAVSIAENVRLARPAATCDEVRRACERALVTEFTDALPDGLDTVLAERGASLSGGQKQRIGIARALLADPAVLILDEASSNLDATSEALLARAIDEARAGRTTITIAHRLSTIRAADEVLVLDEGRLVQRGRGAELLGRPGRFAELMGPQLADDRAG